MRYFLNTLTHFHVFLVNLPVTICFALHVVRSHELQEVLVDDPDLIIEDIDFSDKYLALIVREGRKVQLCSVGLPLPYGKVVEENLLHLLQINS